PPVWSPDGKQIAFLMDVPEKVKPFVELPEPPPGAEWAAPPKVIRKTIYRFDGRGYLKDARPHLFVMPAEGGTPRRLSGAGLDLGGAFRQGSRIAWAPDGKAVFVSGRARAKDDEETLDTEIFEISIGDGVRKALTDRRGPDHSPAISRDGSRIAYVG